ncbi:E3 SUMO-protein ligase ZBED1-like [Girardinichthys multiradiatus]|uniref:E3 SUMO-protein ligase ZBED1-like n=1 Tax=Girardinichthys multiradiatus TaxID=208333 RepID=UPI001FAD6110|nr:E3 SUMO-protein ligase ZBED1-like [Girardinichthys multiradiatus]
MAESDSNLVPKKNAKSVIWAYFRFYPNANGEPQDLTQPICTLCKLCVPAKDRQTTNLFAHIRVHHPAEAAKLSPTSSAAGASGGQPRGQPTMSAAFAKSTKYRPGSERWTKCTTAVARFLAKECIPFQAVERESFKKNLTTLDAQYEPPGRKYFSETAVPKLYEQLRGEIVNELKEANFIALTTDMWSNINMSPYMSITAHYVSKDWTLKSKCLETAFTPESHTAAVLAEALQDGLQAWGIGEEKVVCITSDNGTNIVAAVRDLKWPWISCFGHNLNLAVKNALNKEKNKTDRAFGVCHQINGAFSHSWQRRQQLRKEQEQQGIKKPLSLITDCATRWGSKYAMTERILTLLPHIRRVFADDRRGVGAHYQPLAGKM